MKVKKLRLCLLLALFLLFCGCATTHETGPPFIASAPPEDRAIVYFYRPSKSTASAITTKVLHYKNLYNFELADGKYIELVVNPGKHMFKSAIFKIDMISDSEIKLTEYFSSPVVFETKPDETHFIKLDYKAFAGTWRFTKQSAEHALEEIKYCNEQKPW
jgi:hypothetical protein